MTGERNYDIHLEDKYGSLEVIDVPAEIAAPQEVRPTISAGSSP